MLDTSMVAHKEEIAPQKSLELEDKELIQSEIKEPIMDTRVEETVASTSSETQPTTQVLTTPADISGKVHKKITVPPKSMEDKYAIEVEPELKKPVNIDSSKNKRSSNLNKARNEASKVSEPAATAAKHLSKETVPSKAVKHDTVESEPVDTRNIERYVEVEATSKIEAKPIAPSIPEFAGSAPSDGHKQHTEPALTESPKMIKIKEQPTKPKLDQLNKVTKMEEAVSGVAEKRVSEKLKDSPAKTAAPESLTEFKDETREKPDQEAQSVPLIQAKEVTSSQPKDSSGPEEAIGARSTVREKPAGTKEIIVSEHLSSESPTGIDDESKAYVGKIVSPNKTNKETKSTTKRVTIQVTSDTGKESMGREEKTTQEYEYDSKAQQPQVIIETPGSPDNLEPLISEAVGSTEVKVTQRMEISEVTTPEAAVIELAEERQKPPMKVSFKDDYVSVPLVQSPDSSSDLLQEDVTERKVKRKKKKKKQPPRSTEIEEIVETVPHEEHVAVILEKPESLPDLPKAQSRAMEKPPSSTEIEDITEELPTQAPASAILEMPEPSVETLKPHYKDMNKHMRSTESEEMVVPPQAPIAVIPEQPEPVPDVPKTQSKTVKLSTTSHTEQLTMKPESSGETAVIKTSTEKKLSSSQRSDHTSHPPTSPPAPSADRAPPSQKQQAKQKDRASQPTVIQKVHLSFSLLFYLSGLHPCMLRLYI